MVDSIADISEDAKIVFNLPKKSTDNLVEFKYGWCRTDHKSGKFIRHDWRTEDYIQDEPYASVVKEILDKMGLPFPKIEEVFRGTRHDLLFLDSHGVVIRIGPLDVNHLMNPAIIQPLGWIENNELRKNGDPFTVAIYPGIELYKNYLEAKKPPKIEGSLLSYLAATGQSDPDDTDGNRGIIRVWDDHRAREVAVKVILDPDSQFQDIKGDSAIERFNLLAKSKTEVPTMGEAVAKTIAEFFNKVADAKWYQKAFEVHEPLRNLFWSGIKDGGGKNMQPFWDACARVTNNPASCTTPVWKKGNIKEGQPEFIRSEIYLPHLVLYRPWTGQVEDKVINPITVPDEIVQSIKRAHRAEFLKEDLRQACRRIRDTALRYIGFR